jgi:hypothetical protein
VRNTRAKYRAWHEVNEEMFDVIEMSNGNPTIISGTFGSQILTPEQTKILDVMQATGRVDLSGQEIFEGDILENDVGAMALVSWVSTSDYVGWILKSAQPGVGLLDWSSRWRVVGNWYKPPKGIDQAYLARWRG